MKFHSIVPAVTLLAIVLLLTPTLSHAKANQPNGRKPLKVMKCKKVDACKKMCGKESSLGCAIHFFRTKDLPNNN